MEYIVFLIYALVYYIILGVKLLQSSDENKKESEQKRKAQQAKALKKDMLFSGIGIILAFLCVITRIFEGRDSYLPLLNRSVILTYLVMAGVTFFSTFLLSLHLKDIDEIIDENNVEELCLSSNKYILISLISAIGGTLMSCFSVVVICIFIGQWIF